MEDQATLVLGAVLGRSHSVLAAWAGGTLLLMRTLGCPWSSGEYSKDHRPFGCLYTLVLRSGALQACP